jgi:hypothetical protein
MRHLTLIESAAQFEGESQSGWGLTDDFAKDMAKVTKGRGPGSLPVADSDLRLAARLYKKAQKEQPRRALVRTQELLAEQGIYKGRSTVHAWIKKAETLSGRTK